MRGGARAGSSSHRSARGAVGAGREDTKQVTGRDPAGNFFWIQVTCCAHFRIEHQRAARRDYRRLLNCELSGDGKHGVVSTISMHGKAFGVLGGYFRMGR